MAKRKKKNILKSILISNHSDNKLRSTAETFNLFVGKEIYNILKNGRFNKRTIIKYIESEEGKVYNIKVNVNKIEGNNVHVEYICTNNNEILINFNTTYDQTSTDSDITKDFNNLTNSIVNL